MRKLTNEGAGAAPQSNQKERETVSDLIFRAQSITSKLLGGSSFMLELRELNFSLSILGTP